MSINAQDLECYSDDLEMTYDEEPPNEKSYGGHRAFTPTSRLTATIVAQQIDRRVIARCVQNSSYIPSSYCT